MVTDTYRLPPAWRRLLASISRKPGTDQEINYRAGNRNLMWTKSMRAELLAAGLLRDSGQRMMSDTGIALVRWQITDLGRRELERNR